MSFLRGVFRDPKMDPSIHSCGFHANKQIQCRYTLRPSSSVNIEERQSHSGFLLPSWWVGWAPFCNDSKNKTCWFPRDVRWYSYICSFVLFKIDTHPKELTWNLENNIWGKKQHIFQTPLICWGSMLVFSGVSSLGRLHVAIKPWFHGQGHIGVYLPPRTRISGPRGRPHLATPYVTYYYKDGRPINVK